MSQRHAGASPRIFRGVRRDQLRAPPPIVRRRREPSSVQPGRSPPPIPFQSNGRKRTSAAPDGAIGPGPRFSRGAVLRDFKECARRQRTFHGRLGTTRDDQLAVAADALGPRGRSGRVGLDPGPPCRYSLMPPRVLTSYAGNAGHSRLESERPRKTNTRLAAAANGTTAAIQRRRFVRRGASGVTTPCPGRCAAKMAAAICPRSSAESGDTSGAICPSVLICSSFAITRRLARSWSTAMSSPSFSDWPCWPGFPPSPGPSSPWLPPVIDERFLSRYAGWPGFLTWGWRQYLLKAPAAVSASGCATDRASPASC